MWCLGDLVGYGADPDACVELARRHAAVCLAGNHDLGVMRRAAARAVLAGRRARREVDSGDDHRRDARVPCPLAAEHAPTRQSGLYHASPRDPVWEYVLSPLQAEMCLDVQKHRVCLIGHSHVALSFSRFPGAPATGETRASPRSTLDLDQELADQPRERRTAARRRPTRGVARAGSRRLDARITGREYDIAGAAAAIRAARFPDSLAERLSYSGSEPGSNGSPNPTERGQPLKSDRGCAIAPRALLAGGLGFAVSFLVACGGGSGLLSAGQARI